MVNFIRSTICSLETDTEQVPWTKDAKVFRKTPQSARNCTELGQFCLVRWAHGACVSCHCCLCCWLLSVRTSSSVFFFHSLRGSRALFVGVHPSCCLQVYCVQMPCCCIDSFLAFFDLGRSFRTSCFRSTHLEILTCVQFCAYCTCKRNERECFDMCTCNLS